MKRKFTDFLAPPALACGALLVGALPAAAAVLVGGPVIQVADHPFAAGCELAPQTGTNNPDAEVEPRVAVNPADPSNAIGVFQQDRWSNGGAHGLVAAVSHNANLTTGTFNKISFAAFSRCTGGNPANGGDFERASDPWVTISPNGTAFQISISFNDSNVINGVLVSRSKTQGDTWETPVTLIRDTAPTLFNDKESITADPNTSANVYAVWDRLVFPEAHASASAAEHALAFRGPALFARTTTGGNTWEAARAIFDPGEKNQTISNQIVVLPASKGGALVNGFELIKSTQSPEERGFSIAVIRSGDQGVSWSDETVIDHQVVAEVTIPFTGQPVRTGDIIPDFSVDRSTGNVYAVWQDGRFGGVASILFSMSTDGGVSWSPAVKISKSPAGVQAFTPSVHVANDGTIGVTYYDFRGATEAFPDRTSTLLVHCHPASGCTNSSGWSENFVAGPYAMTTAPVAEGFFVGDYEGLTRFGSHGFRPFFIQAQRQATKGMTDPFTAVVCPTSGTC